MENGITEPKFKQNGVSEVAVPAGFVPLDHQLAGHKLNKPDQKQPYGMLDGLDGTILKPVLPNKGMREISFYELVYNGAENEYFSINESDKRLLPKLRRLIPDYRGTEYLPEHENIPYIRLYDITKQFKHAFSIDVKIGAIACAPTKSPEGKHVVLERCPSLEEIKFQLLGLRYLDATSQDWIYELKLRKLDPHQLLHEGFLPMFKSISVTHSLSVIRLILTKLNRIKEWFQQQTSFQFFASSVLIVFEGSEAACDSSSHDLVDVKMIDFTHVYRAQSVDENYTAGLESLILYFCALRDVLNHSDDVMMNE